MTAASKTSGSIEQPAQEALPGARAALLLLLSINLFNYIDRQVLAAVVPEIRQEFFSQGSTPGPAVQFLLDTLQSILGANPENALIGLLSMAFMVSYMLMAPIFGWLKIKRWWVIAGGVAIWSLASGATGLAGSFGLLLLTRCIVGVGEAAFGPVAPSMLSDFYPEKIRGSILSWFYVALPVGSALGFVLGGLVAAYLGWRWAFYLVVPPGIILAVSCFFMKEPEHKSLSSAKKGMSFSDYREILKTPSYLLNTLGMAFMCFAVGGMGFWMPSYIHEYRGVGNLAQVNLIFGSILVVSGLTATLSGGWLADKLRARYPGAYLQVSGWGMLLAVPFFLAALYIPFPYAWVCLFITCFCLFLNTGPSNTALANVTRPEMRASAFALNILVIHLLGDVLSPLLIGALTDMLGNDMTKAFLSVSITIFAGSILWLFGARYLQADTERAQAKAHH
ncbi:MAG: MFS transporter [Candidatus Obscuribacterales bacterium]|nr:MFS transporter [Candidatus Obscuribacterales bacterium]